MRTIQLLVRFTRRVFPALAGLAVATVPLSVAQADSQSYTWYTNQVDRVIYMAPGGTGNGSSATSPLGSLRAAVQQALSASNEATPKDVKIFLKNGTYSITGSGDFSGANLSSILVFEGESAGGVILDGSAWTVDDPALTVHGYKRNVAMRNLIFKNFRKSATVFAVAILGRHRMKLRITTTGWLRIASGITMEQRWCKMRRTTTVLRVLTSPTCRTLRCATASSSTIMALDLISWDVVRCWKI